MSQLVDEKIIASLQNNINRFDHYIAESNNKSNVILAFNGVLIGAILLKYDVLLKLFESNLWCLNIAIFSIILLGLISIISIRYAFLSIDPFLKSGNVVNKYHSLLFFKSISEMDEEIYIKKIEECTIEDLKNDLARQSYQLAKGLTIKYGYAKKSVYFIYMDLSIFFFLLILKIIVLISGSLG
jgi:hypothetical protein